LTFDTLTYINSTSNNSPIITDNNFFIIIIAYIIGASIWAFCVWCWLIVLIGYGRKYLSKPNSFINYLSKITLPYYILHQTVIIIIGFYVIQWELDTLTKFLIISTTALFITLILCVLVKTNNITRFIFGMKTIRKNQPQ
jgi:hypothetical protein